MIRRFFGRPAPNTVVGYRSYGTRDRLLVLGRALEDEGLVTPDVTHSRWRNLREALKRFDADPLAHARVRSAFGEAEAVLETNDEGFLHHWMSLPRPITHTGWQEVHLELVDAGGRAAKPGVAQVLVPSETARFGVISDLDDTVLQSSVATPVRAARLMLFENSRTRLPFPGVAAFYRALAAGADGEEANPIFYVSSSPWNVHDVLADFLDAQGIPLGPLLLRDWDLDRSLVRNAGHKAALIREVFDTYPAMPFILVGDTSQEDPEIYTEVLREHPGRVLAIYIRDVGASDARRGAVQELVATVEQSGAALILSPDTLGIARHAAERGWISSASLPEIGEEKREDEGTVPGKTEPPQAIG